MCAGMMLWRAAPQSIFFRQQNTSRRAVGFCNYPEPVPRAGAVGAQEPEAVLKRQLVFLCVFGRNFSPITTGMTGKKIPRLLACLFKRGQRTGGSNNTTECEERLHAVTEARCFS